MGAKSTRLSSAERAELVAYLDGELDEERAREVSTRLTQDPDARQELEELKETWNLLDHLPQPRVSAEFGSQTLTRVHLSQPGETRALGSARHWWSRFPGALAWGALILLGVALGHSAMRWVGPQPTDRLIRELSLAEHLDEFRDLQTFEFLEQLARTPEFGSEGSEPAPGSSVAASVGPDPDSAARARLQMMPPESRRELSLALGRLDRLPPAEQAALRRLDRQIAALPPVSRARLLEVAHRYHLWFQSLDEARRQTLKEAPAEARMRRVQRLRSTVDRAGPSRRSERVWLLSPVLNPPPSLIDAAFLIKSWFAIGPADRAKVNRLPPNRRLLRLKALGEEADILHDWSPWPEDLEKVPRGSQPKPNPIGPAAGKRDLARARNPRAGLRRRLVAYDLEHDPPPVQPATLARFEAALPDWLRDAIDPLPPEIARRRLARLYDLVEPSPSDLAPEGPVAQEPAAGG